MDNLTLDGYDKISNDLKHKISIIHTKYAKYDLHVGIFINSEKSYEASALIKLTNITNKDFRLKYLPNNNIDENINHCIYHNIYDYIVDIEGFIKSVRTAYKKVIAKICNDITYDYNIELRSPIYIILFNFNKLDINKLIETIKLGDSGHGETEINIIIYNDYTLDNSYYFTTQINNYKISICGYKFISLNDLLTELF